MEQQPAADGGERRFKAHDQRSDRRIEILLADHLQCIGDARRHDARVEDGNERLVDLRQLRHLLQKKHADQAEDSRDKELNAGQADAVAFRRKVVDEKDLEREKERAGDDEQVSFGDAESFIHAQQIKPRHGDDDADPDEK